MFDVRNPEKKSCQLLASKQFSSKHNFFPLSLLLLLLLWACTNSDTGNVTGSKSQTPFGVKVFSSMVITFIVQSNNSCACSICLRCAGSTERIEERLLWLVGDRSATAFGEKWDA